MTPPGARLSRDPLRERVALWWLRIKNRVRCDVGIHNLVGYRDAGDGIHVMPIDPRALPGPKDSRKCNYCGAHWKGGYDGMSPFWVKTRGPIWRRPAPMGPPRVRTEDDD